MANLTFQALESFTPVLDGWKQAFFTTAAITVTCAALVIQRAVYRTLMRLGSRHINQMIVPSQVIFNIMTPLKLMSLIGKAYYYPLKDITGPFLCYADTYLDLWSSMYAHFLTFFVSLFRYICLFHDDELIKRNISPRVSRNGP